ncbi:MAG: sirohydrochlorin cobaltochelatase [Oscillospiraceae bacterium]|nr:sirohydrochlorin cobaltochelatase [Oscillospiraceae bacterium]
MKKLNTLLMSLAMVSAVLTGCGTSTENTPESSDETAVPETSVLETTTLEEETKSEETSADAEAENNDEEENYNTGDASLDKVRNEDGIGENELLVISFGTSFNDSRRLTIGAIEGALDEAFPDYDIRRGFTANIVIDHVQSRDGVLIDDVDSALNRAINNGVKNLVIQPTHLMNGLEYHDVVAEVAQYADAFEHVSFGEPLLTSDEDFKRVEQAIVDWTSEFDDGETAICFMGHGTEADSNQVYQKMQDLLTADGYENYFVGTVEAEPSVEDVLSAVQEGNYKRVILEPLMVVAGDHANNDMAGDEEDSWKSVFESAGYEVECLLRGLGENEDIQKIYIDHAQTAVDALTGENAE